MNVAFNRNVGSFLRAVPAFGATTINTGNDAAPVNGLTIDRQAIVPMALSALVALQLEITDLGDDETLEIVMTAQDSANGTDWDPLDIGPPDEARSKTYDAVVEDVPVVAEFKAQLGAARRYVRFVFTPTLSAGSSDAVAIRGGIAVFAGYDELPAADYVAPPVS